MSKKNIEKDLKKVTGGSHETAVKETKKAQEICSGPIHTASLCQCVHNPKVFDGVCGECQQWKQTGFGLCMTANGIPGECHYKK